MLNVRRLLTAMQPAQSTACQVSQARAQLPPPKLDAPVTGLEPAESGVVAVDPTLAAGVVAPVSLPVSPRSNPRNRRPSGLVCSRPQHPDPKI